MFSFSLYAQELEFYVGAKKVKTYSATQLKKKAKSFQVYNPFRKALKVYYGLDFIKLLDESVSKRWRRAKVVKFEALDGFIQQVEIPVMVKKLENKHQGILALGEERQIGFADFEKKGKMVNPGPFYLVWTGFDEKAAADYNDPLKWPYQLKRVVISE